MMSRKKKIRKVLEKMEEMIKLREKREKEYEKTKEEFEKVLGKPSIHFKIEIPEGYEDMTSEFLHLESDEKFKGKIRTLVKRQLKQEREREKTREKVKSEK